MLQSQKTFLFLVILCVLMMFNLGKSSEIEEKKLRYEVMDFEGYIGRESWFTNLWNYFLWGFASIGCTLIGSVSGIFGSNYSNYFQCLYDVQTFIPVR